MIGGLGRSDRMSKAETKGLRQLARLHGVMPEFQDSARDWREAAPRRSSACCVPSGPGPGDGGRRRGDPGPHQHMRSRKLEPVTLAWEGSPPLASLELPGAARRPSSTAHSLRGRLGLRAVDGRRRLSRTCQQGETEGERHLLLRLPIRGPLPTGYHRLRVRVRGGTSECLVIVAPHHLPGEAGGSLGPSCPLYGLHRGSSWGAGDFSDLAP